ncbi:hypothetical protein fugu_010838 [Takifugu bimaculatus]|uniref:Uncharacterized protein n=1 Tax=Takifugu bimaculatus TaxID=433685 RepID=A0A4Z2CBA2_9TELE|nr:hypothetical protein fugu_010838 [Takifugu bimaculatus]
MVPLVGALLILTKLLLCCGPVRCLEVDFCSPQRADEHPQGRAEQAGDGGVVFKLRAFTRDLYLRLTPDSGFLAPPESRAAASAASDLRDCFYSGDVNADPDSFAALSLCGGLSGGFSYDGMEYFISPGGSARAAPGDPAERTHVISRRGRVDPGGSATRRCGVAPGGNFSASLERYRHLSETVLAGGGQVQEVRLHPQVRGGPGGGRRVHGQRSRGGPAALPADPHVGGGPALQAPQHPQPHQRGGGGLHGAGGGRQGAQGLQQRRADAAQLLLLAEEAEQAQRQAPGLLGHGRPVHQAVSPTGTSGKANPSDQELAPRLAGVHPL